MDILVQDLRYATRTLMRSPGFALIAALCLALGIGVNTAIFSLVRGVLFRPLPFANADRLTVVQAADERRGVDEIGITYADLQELRTSGLFDQIEGVDDRNVTLTAGDQPERIEAAAVTPALFQMIGIQPQIGRLFRADEGAPAGFEQVVLLSDGLWRTRFGGDPGIVNQTVHINGRQLTVVGIMPPAFTFPRTEKLWLPLGMADATNRQARFILGLGTLRDNVTMPAANGRLAEIAERWSTQYSATHRNWTLRAVSYRDSIVDAQAQKLMYLMLGAVAFVLLIACANVANLLLARATDRAAEIAVRAALGAGRARVMRQLVTESVLLALAGGAAGILVSIWWLDAMVRTIPEELPFWMRFEVDAAVLLYTLVISLATGILFGLVPALQATRADLQSSLRETTRSAGATRAQNRLRSTLVVGEIALSMVLLIGAVLMMQSFLRLQAADPGFDTRRMLSFRLTLAGDQYDAVEARAQYFQRAAERLAQLPGVAGAAATGAIPADDGGYHLAIRRDGERRTAEQALIATEVAIGRNFFATLGVPLSAGRDFTPHEVADTAARVAILGERLARRLFPDQDALGRVVRLGEGEGERFTVIGVARDLQYEEFGEDQESDRLQVHVPYAQWSGRQMSFLVRANGVPNDLTNRVRAELRSMDATLAPWDIQTLDQRRLYTTWEQRIFGKTFGIFGGTALVLALSGVYGVMAYSVARRRREIGVRVALGARPSDVMRLVVGRALLIAAGGVAIGVVAAFAFTRVLTGLVWGVSVSDPLTFVVTPVLLAGAAVLASYIPARRAARVDPILALKAE